MNAPNLAKKLKQWMEANNKTVVDVASMTRVSPKTVERFIEGETKHPMPLILDAFKTLIEEKEE